MTTIKQAAGQFLDNIKKSQPHNTWKAYRSDLLGRTGFIAHLAPHLKPSANISELTEDVGAGFIQVLLDHGAAPSARQRRAACLREFFRFVSAEYNSNLSVDRLTYKLKSRHLLTGSKNNIDFPAQKIEKVLAYTKKMVVWPADLRTKRDLALIWTLAETGLRVSEACSLKVGDIDKRWRATFTGKGNKLATIQFGKNSRAMITAYLHARAAQDASTKKPRGALPLFARHDQTSGKAMVKPINPKTAEKAIHRLSYLALGEAEYDPRITAHKMRHYFVTMILRKTRDIKAAKDLARHSNIATTERYSHRDSEENAEIATEVFG